MNDKQKAIESVKENPLDRERWISLGKACLTKCWACKGELYFRDSFTGEIDKNKECGNCDMKGTQERNWKQDWHDFIDHLASGKSLDSFFESLLEESKEEMR